jgi:hypothetical protein
MRAVPRLCELYPGICLTTEEKHGKTSVRVAEEHPLKKEREEREEEEEAKL